MPDAEPEQKNPRGFLAPGDRLQRILYALMVVFLPYTLYHVYPRINDDLVLVTGLLWWVIATFYTITWISNSLKDLISNTKNEGGGQ